MSGIVNNRSLSKLDIVNAPGFFVCRTPRRDRNRWSFCQRLL